MNTWTQISLNTLAGAIETHLTTTPWSEQHGYLLVDARNRANSALQGINVDERALHDLRDAVCRVCRQYHLYECDVPAGWSITCALLRKNA
jgi:hypothetical protein